MTLARRRPEPTAANLLASGQADWAPCALAKDLPERANVMSVLLTPE